MDGARESRQDTRDVALGRLLTRSSRSVRHQLRMHDLCRHGIDEDDVEQDVRIRLWTTLRREPGCELSGAYIQRVVLSAIIDAVRRARTRRLEFTQDLQAVENTHPDDARPPDQQLAHAQWLELLNRCLTRLPPRRQGPVRLHLLGYTMQELSDLSGLTLDAGSKLVRRGLADLRALLVQARDAS